MIRWTKEQLKHAVAVKQQSLKDLAEVSDARPNTQEAINCDLLFNKIVRELFELEHNVKLGEEEEPLPPLPANYKYKKRG